MSGLKAIFHCEAHIDIFSKPLFIWLADTLMSLTTEKMDVSLANDLAVDETPLARSLMYIKKSKFPNIKLCETPGSSGFPAEIWPFITTPWNLIFRKL